MAGTFRNWSHDEVERRRLHLAATCGLAPGPPGTDEGLATLSSLLDLVRRPPQSPRTLVDEFVLIEAIVDLNWWFRSHALIDAAELERLVAAAERILDLAGIERGESKLDALYDPLDLARAAALADAGRWAEALWRLTGLRREGRSQGGTSSARLALETARCHLRVGNAGLARQAAQEALAASQHPELMLRARVLIITAARLAGEQRAVRAMLRDLPAAAAGPAGDALRWERVKAEAGLGDLADGFYRAALAALPGAPALLELRLYAFADAHPTRASFVPKAATLLRRIQWQAHAMEAYRPLVKVLKVLEDAYDRRIPLNARIASIGILLRRSHELATVEQELLLLAGVARWAQRFGQLALADLVFRDYAALSSRLSSGLSRDALGALGAVEAEPRAPSTNRRLAAARLAAETAGIAASGRLRRLFAREDERARLKDSEMQRIAERLVSGLGSLRGGLMKVAQVAAYGLTLPAPIKEGLALLQYGQNLQVKPMSEAELTAAIGQPPRTMFRTWEAQPLAIGSIGAVYRARTHEGDDVVVKVRHAGIVRAVESDLANLWAVKVVLRRLMPAADIDGIAAEIRDVVLAELDYAREAAACAEFAALFADDQTIKIPRVFPAYSHAEALTSEFLLGLRFDEFLAVATPAAKQRAAAAIIRMNATAFHRGCMLNCDPHPGNYIFMHDGRVGFVDFGCVKRWDAGFVGNWRAVAASIMADDFAGNVAAFRRLGYDGGDPAFDYRGHYAGVRAIFAPLLGDGPFEFTADYAARIRDLHVDGNINLRRVSPPKEAAFMTRITFGLVDILVALGARGDYRGAVRAALSGSAA